MKKFVVSIVLVVAFLSIPHGVSAHSGTYAVTKWNGTYIRTCPSTRCGKVLRLYNGDWVTAFKHRGNWVYVTDGEGSYGWVGGNTIQKIYPSSSSGSGGGTSSGSDYCTSNTWGDYICAPGWIGDAIFSGAYAYGVDPWYMLQLAACESNFNPDEYSWAGAVGVFQFLPDTFYSYGSGDVWNVSDQSYVAAYMLSIGEGPQWDCYWRI